MWRQIFLGILFIFLSYLVYRVPAYKTWHEGRILNYYNSFNQILKNRGPFDTSSRIKTRYGGKIDFYAELKKILAQTKPDEALSEQIILIPSDAYNKENGFNFKFDEPAVVYLLGEGLRVVLPYGEKAKTANWVFTVENGNPRIIPIDSDEMRNNYIENYKNFSYSL